MSIVDIYLVTFVREMANIVNFKCYFSGQLIALEQTPLSRSFLAIMSVIIRLSRLGNLQIVS